MLPSQSSTSVLRAATAAAAALVTLVGLLLVTPSPATAADGEELHLVTLKGPGTAATSASAAGARGVSMVAAQNLTLQAVDAPEPVYRWTTALNGYAVRLTPDQVQALEADPAVAAVEANEVRALTGFDGGLGATRLPTERLGEDLPLAGGAGTVVGIVDTGIAPESPLFSQLRHERGSASFDGSCAEAEEWSSSQCNGKLVGARWYADGFGVDELSSTSTLSPRDDDGHGTQMATIAVGNAGVPVQVGGERLGEAGGIAPDAQLAVYKACWGAPDPDDDGCATADLVTAIDDATRDGVDVLSLSVAGPSTIDTVERALLGAAESGVVVTAAAGNGGADESAAHPSPWVTTVGGSTGELRRGRVVLPSDLRAERLDDLTGAMLSRRSVGPAPVVLGADVAVDGADRGDARVCAPGSLDAASVAGAVVVCERGRVGRTDKSRTVDLADGLAMVLVNQRRDSVDLDVHSVPTVHLDQAAGGRLVEWVEDNPGERVTLRSLGAVRRPTGVAALSASGSLGAGVLKPDVLAPATGVLGAVPGSGSGDTWGFVSGTSASAAYAAGAAARLVGATDWTAAEVRSALVTTAAPVDDGTLLRTGAGRLRPDRAGSPGLAYVVQPGDYRAWLEGGITDLNTPSALMRESTTTVTRTVTNLAARRLYFSSSARGFRSDVSVSPAALRLGPGESADVTITVDRRSPQLDDGYVVWRGARGSVTRIPVVLGR